MTHDPPGYASLKAATHGYRFEGFGVVGLAQWLRICRELEQRRAEIAALERMARP